MTDNAQAESLRIRRRIRKAAVFTPRPDGRQGLVLAEIGNIGAAKTATWKQDARAWGFRIETLTAGLRPPEDYLGIPRFSEDGRFFTYAAPRWVKECLENPYTIVVFDDWTAGTSGKILGAQLTISLEAKVGEVDLPNETRIFMLYNPTKQAPGGKNLPMANANRVGHLRVGSPTPQEYASWVLTHGQARGTVEEVYEQELDPKKEEARVLERWPEDLAWASGIMAGAVVAHPELLENIPEHHDPNASKSFPTCRSTDHARLALASSRTHDLDVIERDLFVGSFIGEGAMATLGAYIVEAEVDPIGVLDGKKPFEFNGRLDRTIALVNACSAYVCQDHSDKRMARAKRLWEIFDKLSDTQADNVIPALDAMRKARLTQMPEGRKLLRKLNPVLEASDYWAHMMDAA